MTTSRRAEVRMLSHKALLLGASWPPALRRMVTGKPATRRVVDRFVAGETVQDALRSLVPRS